MFSLLVLKMILEEKTKVISAARKAAREYCERNGLSLAKLANQDYYYFGDCVGIMQRMPYHGSGLLEDIVSQPKPTLTYVVDSGIIEPTIYTTEYLS